MRKIDNRVVRHGLGIFFIVFSLGFFSLTGIVFGEDFSSETAEQKAQEAHDLAASDMIYQQADFKALYYQNIQMIDLLKEIRDEVKSANMRAAKDTNRS